MVIFVKSCVFTFWAEHRFFSFFFFNSSIRHVQWKSVFIAFSPCLTNYDVKRRKHIMILLICVLQVIKLVLVANAILEEKLRLHMLL